MIYSAIIVDDEELAISLIKNYLKKHGFLKIVAECNNGFEALKAIQTHKPDLVFLDIQMPKLTGFELLELLEDPPHVIFSTAYDQYALKAFEHNAVDYLLKPYSEERFDHAIEKAHMQISKGKDKGMIENLKSHLEQQQEEISRIVVKSGSSIRIFYHHQIRYLEAQDDYVMIYTEEGKFLKQQTLKFYEDHLNKDEFIRIHRSYIVNIHYISKVELFEKASYRLLLKTGDKLPVSRSGYQRLKEQLNF
jgi:two-component system, LytTR family, response regulator